MSSVESLTGDQRPKWGAFNAPSLKGDARWELVLRIAASPEFRKSARLRDFLLYVSERALSNHAKEVSEQFIGLRVFGRPIDYNPAEDNIVRVSARQLRSKLKEYFEVEGREEEWLLEIPKGCYLPVFRGREPQRVPGAAGIARTPIRAAAPIRRWTIALGATAAISLALNLSLWSGHKAPASEPASASTPNFVTALFGRSRRPTQVVLTDSALVLMETLAGRKFSLEAYASRDYLRPLKILPDDPHIRSFWDFLAERQLSNIGEMAAADRIRMSMAGRGPEVIIRNAREMSTRDFETGNFILFGTAHSNPWTQLFCGGRLNFQFATDGFGALPGIRNVSPRLGERPAYFPEMTDGKVSVSYARVALVPNLTNNGRVLLVSGIGMESTEAAADFLLSPISIEDIQAIPGMVSTHSIPNMELLLKTSSMEGAPTSAHVVAYRIHRQSSSRELATLSFSK